MSACTRSAARASSATGCANRQADASFIADVERLIVAHEVGGWPEADLVQAADSLSILDVNIDLFLGFVRSGRFTLPDVRAKFELSRDRIRVPHLRALAAPMADRALERLRALEMELA